MAHWLCCRSLCYRTPACMHACTHTHMRTRHTVMHIVIVLSKDAHQLLRSSLSALCLTLARAISGTPITHTPAQQAHVRTDASTLRIPHRAIVWHGRVNARPAAWGPLAQRSRTRAVTQPRALRFAHAHAHREGPCAAARRPHQCRAGSLVWALPHRQVHRAGAHWEGSCAAARTSAGPSRTTQDA